MRSHLLHLLLYATLVSTYFAILVRRERRAQIKLGAIVWVSMVGGALALAALMYPFPD